MGSAAVARRLRLYHPFRSEEAMRAWNGQHSQFNRSEARVLEDFLTSTLRWS